MRAKIAIKTGLPRTGLEERLENLSAAGPFRVRDVAHQGDDVWSFSLQPLRPGLTLGFAKFAEMLVLLAREFHIETVERIAAGAASAASSTPPSDGVQKII